MEIDAEKILSQDRLLFRFCGACHAPLLASWAECQDGNCPGHRSGEIITRQFAVAGKETLQLKRLALALGMFSPSGSAPRAALDAIWEFCTKGGDLPMKELSAMIHWLENYLGDREMLAHPPKLPDPDTEEYASNLSILDDLRRLKALASQDFSA